MLQVEPTLYTAYVIHSLHGPGFLEDSLDTVPLGVYQLWVH